MELKIKLITQS